ncbi:hypothetical protein TcWFU_010250 [Taenia crassiceps]|uniref:Uncharacterized protein n=1 Tax=Taenia crassiceps TaxID=6207 RepID=A0ABR4QTL4_9CEST
MPIHWFPLSPRMISLPGLRIILPSFHISLDYLRFANVSLLLEALLQTCSEVVWNSALQQWLYGGLLSLEPPLLPNTCYTVRQIGKNLCKYLRKSEHRKGNDSMDRLFCFVIVSVVAFAFGQRDLLEDI